MVRSDATPGPDLLLSKISPGSLRVLRPPNKIFLCGGPLTGGPAASARAQIYAALQEGGATLALSTILAESAQNLFEERIYDDLVSFEADIATLCTTILLVAESAGAIAELGAFSMHENYKHKMRILIPDTHLEERSFIMLGPARHLRTQTGRPTIFYDPASAWSGEAVKPSWLAEVLALVAKDAGAAHQSERFNPSAPLHAMVATLFVCWLHLAARRKDVADGLAALGVRASKARVAQMLFTLKVFGYLDQVAVGSAKFYVPRDWKPPFDYTFIDGWRDYSDRLRLRATISEHYRQKGDRRRLEAAGRRARAGDAATAQQRAELAST